MWNILGSPYSTPLEILAQVLGKFVTLHHIAVQNMLLEETHLGTGHDSSQHTSNGDLFQSFFVINTAQKTASAHMPWE